MTVPLPRPLAVLPLPWPLPAVATWATAWAAYVALRPAAGAAIAAAAALAVGLALALGWRRAPAWRRGLLALGFPVSALVAGAAGAWPAWVWLLPLALLALAYPLRAWGDAPVFPTPAGALDALARLLPLAPGARVLDAGCGLGDGLRALRSAWPQAAAEGVEWSWPLALIARRRCRWAPVRRGDMWAGSWRGFALVYLFQRPESMARAWAKACAEMAPGSWLVSLEFSVPGVAPALVAELAGGRRVLAWRVAPQPAGPRADISG